MSLRLWSDTQELTEVVQELRRPPRHHYRKGEVIQIGRQQRSHVPKRHYVSYPDVGVHEFGAIEPWLASEFDLLERSEQTASLIRNGVVEAVLWVAVFASTRVEPPPICDEIVERARSLGSKIFVENYSYDPKDRDEAPSPDGDDICSAPKIPTKTWYPAEQA